MSDLSLSRRIHKFIGETDAVWGLQVRLSSTSAVTEAFRPIFKVLEAEDKLNEIKKEGDAKIFQKFEEEIQKANQ